MATPDPLVPEETDLRDFYFMPLDVGRLRDSRMAYAATGEEFRSAVLLWCASWHQCPAASLPDDDVQLAHLAGFGRVVSEWLKVREGTLRGFVKCSDGRLYHPYIAKVALKAWHDKLVHRWEKECDRLRKENKARDGKELPPLPMPEKPKLSTLENSAFRRKADGIPTEISLKGEGKGEREGKNEYPPTPHYEGEGVTGDCWADEQPREGWVETPHAEDGKKPSEPAVTNAEAKTPDSEDFEVFWEAYPKKIAKGRARRAWKKLKPDEQLLSRILSAIERAKTSVQWTREGGQYIPHPASWLNAEGWEDEHEKAPAATNQKPGLSSTQRGNNHDRPTQRQQARSETRTDNITMFAERAFGNIAGHGSVFPNGDELSGEVDAIDAEWTNLGSGGF